MKKFSYYIERLIDTLTAYPRAERRGAVLIVAVVTGILFGIVLTPAQAPDPAALAETDRLYDSLRQDYFLRLTSERRSGSPSAGYSERAGQRKNDSSAPRTSTYPAPKKAVYIELNSADSIRLRTVRGVGAVISRNIVEYRARLGGFVRKEQLKEVWGITDENFGEISAQFFIDTAAVQKININFATSNQLGSHPYITPGMARRILRARESKGGWNQLRELVDNDILLPDEARKVAPYVVFEVR